MSTGEISSIMNGRRVIEWTQTEEGRKVVVLLVDHLISCYLVKVSN